MNIAIASVPGSNYHRLKKWCDHYLVEYTTFLVGNARIASAHLDYLILPGNGHYDSFARWIGEDSWLRSILFNREIPIIGICSGAHIMHQGSMESQNNLEGIGIFEGFVTKIPGNYLNVGFKPVNLDPVKLGSSSLFFCHAYCMPSASNMSICCWSSSPDEDVSNTSIVALKSDGVNFAMQFHPEMSGSAGVKIMRSLLANHEQQ